MGIIMWATVEAKRRLSELVTLIGRVSETRPVCFLGIRKRRPWLKPGGGWWPRHSWDKTANRRGAARSGAARQAAKGIPSGPGVELLDLLMASVTDSRVGSKGGLSLTVLL